MVVLFVLLLFVVIALQIAQLCQTQKVSDKAASSSIASVRAETAAGKAHSASITLAGKFTELNKNFEPVRWEEPCGHCTNGTVPKELPAPFLQLWGKLYEQALAKKKAEEAKSAVPGRKPNKR